MFKLTSGPQWSPIHVAVSSYKRKLTGRRTSKYDDVIRRHYVPVAGSSEIARCETRSVELLASSDVAACQASINVNSTPLLLVPTYSTSLQPALRSWRKWSWRMAVSVGLDQVLKDRQKSEQAVKALKLAWKKGKATFPRRSSEGVRGASGVYSGACKA